MLFINPQWQGSGLTDELSLGVETLKEYFNNSDFTEIPLSTKKCASSNNIVCFQPILEQIKYFRDLVSERKPPRISTIGGDCGIEIIPISYLNKIYQKDVCVIWLDSHADLNTPETSPSKCFHGMPVRTLLNEGNKQIIELLFSSLEPEQICFVGLRDLDVAERDYISKYKMASFSKPAFEEIRAVLDNFKYVYIHLDLDVLDETEYPHTLFPSSNGLLIDEVEQLLRDLKENSRVVGFGITESTATSLEQISRIRPILNHVIL